MKMNESAAAVDNVDGAANYRELNFPPCAKQILIPLDLMRGPVAPLRFAQGIAMETPSCVTLLHVVNVKLPPGERRAFDELCAEARFALTKLAWLFFSESTLVRVSIRIGRPQDEILAEAKTRGADLIILSGGKRRGWTRFWRKSIAARVAEAAFCPTLVLPEEKSDPADENSISRFDSTWARQTHSVQNVGGGNFNCAPSVECGRLSS